MKRPGKFYFTNEKKVLKSLGLTPAPASGSGWVVKEDGENERCMVQLKSTDADSYRITMLDIKKLEYHSMVSNKTPIFLVQFLKQGKIYAIVDIDNLSELPYALGEREVNQSSNFFVDSKEVKEVVKKKVVSSSKKEREKFMEERRSKFARRK